MLEAYRKSAEWAAGGARTSTAAASRRATSIYRHHDGRAQGQRRSPQRGSPRRQQLHQDDAAVVRLGLRSQRRDLPKANPITGIKLLKGTSGADGVRTEEEIACFEVRWVTISQDAVAACRPSPLARATEVSTEDSLPECPRNAARSIIAVVRFPDDVASARAPPGSRSADLVGPSINALLLGRAA